MKTTKGSTDIPFKVGQKVLGRLMSSDVGIFRKCLDLNRISSRRRLFVFMYVVNTSLCPLSVVGEQNQRLPEFPNKNPSFKSLKLKEDYCKHLFYGCDFTLVKSVLSPLTGQVVEFGRRFEVTSLHRRLVVYWHETRLDGSEGVEGPVVHTNSKCGF